jgi:hypothetical protein
MAITSKGYPETIAPGSDFALMAYAFGRQYVAPFVSHCQVAASSTGTRRVTISTGYLAGKHIVDYNDAVVNIDLPNASGASQWFCIVLNRWVDAGGGLVKSEFGYVAGTSTKAIPALTQNPGTYDQQPIALVRISSTATLPQDVVDLRAIAEEPGTYTIYDDLALDAIDRPGVTAYNAKTGITYRRVYNESQARAWQIVREAPSGPRPAARVGTTSAFSGPITSGSVPLYGGDASGREIANGGDNHFTAYNGGSNATQALTNAGRIVTKTGGWYHLKLNVVVRVGTPAIFDVVLERPGFGPSPRDRRYILASQDYAVTLTDEVYLPAGATIGPRWGATQPFTPQEWSLSAVRAGD